MWVKICGITNEEDALLAVALGADALGFVFAPGSPRQVGIKQVSAIVERLPPGTTTIGVFRDERPETVVNTVNRIGLSGAQLHGREPRSEVATVRSSVPFVIQAFAVGDPELGRAAASPADAVLFDAPRPGSGQVYDWSLSEGVPGGVRLILAGGLDPGNVKAAILRVRPWGVDVSSGVETTAGSGTKDPVKLRHFIASARVAGEEIARTMRPPTDAADREIYDWQADER